jgi:hypothetical protein
MRVDDEHNPYTMPLCRFQGLFGVPCRVNDGGHAGLLISDQVCEVLHWADEDLLEYQRRRLRIWLTTYSVSEMDFA